MTTKHFGDSRYIFIVQCRNNEMMFDLLRHVKVYFIYLFTNYEDNSKFIVPGDSNYLRGKAEGNLVAVKEGHDVNLFTVRSKSMFIC